MRRFLIIDDEVELSFDEELAIDNLVDGIKAEVVHLNPNRFIERGEGAEHAVDLLLAAVDKHAKEFWDVVAIDLNLGAFGFSDSNRDKEVCLQVAEAVRESNQAATLFLYSGTLARYISEILKGGASDTQLRRIFQAEVRNFVPRNRIAAQITSSVDDPSWVLRVDRLFTQYRSYRVAPEVAEFRGRTIEELAVSVRRQDADGQRVVELISEYGLSSFMDLNCETPL